jgi:hypothetical protein
VDGSPQNPPTEGVLPATAAILSDGGARYSRDQLLDVYRMQSATPTSIDVSDLFVNGWNPAHANGTGRSSWGKNDGYVPQEPGICWDVGGQVKPMGLQAMSEEEREVCPVHLVGNSDVESSRPAIYRSDDSLLTIDICI